MSRRFRICMAKGDRESARPSYGRPKLTLISRERKYVQLCLPKLFGHNFNAWTKSFSEDFLNVYKKNPRRQEDLALRSKLWPNNFGLHRRGCFVFSWNKDQLWPPVTGPRRLSSPLCHTYSEPSGHELSPGGTQNIPYLFKNLSKSRLSDPFFGLFLVISEVGSQIYIANLAIECFQQLFGMKSHCKP